MFVALRVCVCVDLEERVQSMRLTFCGLSRAWKRREGGAKKVAVKVEPPHPHPPLQHERATVASDAAKR